MKCDCPATTTTSRTDVTTPATTTSNTDVVCGDECCEPDSPCAVNRGDCDCDDACLPGLVCVADSRTGLLSGGGYDDFCRPRSSVPNHVPTRCATTTKPTTTTTASTTTTTTTSTRIACPSSYTPVGPGGMFACPQGCWIMSAPGTNSKCMKCDCPATTTTDGPVIASPAAVQIPATVTVLAVISMVVMLW